MQFFRALGEHLTNLFIPIYLYQITSFGILGVFFYYLMMRAVNILLSLLIGEFISRKGVRFVLILGNLFNIFSFIVLILMEVNTNFFLLFMIIKSYN